MNRRFKKLNRSRERFNRLYRAGESIDDDEFKTYNKQTIDLLERFNWKRDNPDYLHVLPDGKNISEVPHFWNSAQQINAMTIFGQWLYESLPDDDDLKDYLNFFMANCYYSENFIWNNNGLMQVYYKEGLEVIRGSDEDIAKSGWSVDSDEAKQFPVLNSCAADTLIALILYNLTDNCAFYIGQEQQNIASTTILSKHWALGVDTPLNPTIWLDRVKSKEWVDKKRHRLVFGPITWLSMTLDIREYVVNKSNPRYKSDIRLGKELWKKVKSNIHVNMNILDYIRTKHIKIDEPYSKLQSIAISHALKMIKNNHKRTSIHGNLIKFILKLVCKHHKKEISQYTVPRAKHTIETIYGLFKDEITELNIIETAKLIQKFYNPSRSPEGLPFIDPLLNEVYLA